LLAEGLCIKGETAPAKPDAPNSNAKRNQTAKKRSPGENSRRESGSRERAPRGRKDNQVDIVLTDDAHPFGGDEHTPQFMRRS